MTEEVEYVLGHFGRGIATAWFVGETHASIVKDEGGVLGRPLVAKVFGLSFPCCPVGS